VTLDDLELELRKLPGVRSAGFHQRDDVLLVQLHTQSTEPSGDLPVQALRIAYRHSEQPVAVEVVRWRDRNTEAKGAAAEAAAMVDLEADEGEPTGKAEEELPGAEEAQAPTASRERRVRLLAVLTFPDTDEVEVHLTLDGQRSIGRGPSSREADGAVDATLDALRRFAPTLEYTSGWTRRIDDSGLDADEGPLCAVGLLSSGAAPRLHGIARGASMFEAATRATLHALNRTLALELWAAR